MKGQTFLNLVGFIVLSMLVFTSIDRDRKILELAETDVKLWKQQLRDSESFSECFKTMLEIVKLFDK